MKKQIVLKVMALLTAVILVSSACSTTDNTAGTDDNINSNSATESVSKASETPAATVVNSSAQYNKEDTDSSWDESTSTKISLDDSSITVDGLGATVQGSILTITMGGTYVVSGSLSDGQILITTSQKETVQLVLNGVNITCKTGAPIYATAADKLVITLADGTRNTVTDGGSSFAYADIANEEPDAAVFSKCDLSINGSGTLTVNAGFNNGIGTKDDLVIVNGSFIVEAANHGLRGRDSLTILNGSFEITAGNDGIQSNNDEDTTKGWISLEGGSYKITAGHDGIQAETSVSVLGGDYTIKTGGASGTSTTSDSYKGMKAVTDLSVSGGTFSIDSDDDCIHANGNVSITGGDFSLNSGDDGIHADADASISGGDINITKCYEGVEGATVNIGGGTINIVSSDDAINAAGGNEGGAGGSFGKDSFASSGSYYINITNGEIVFAAGGDGMDSNGDINISGGTVIALIKSSPDNGAIDSDGTFTATGGTIIYGGTGVGQVPGGSSTQSYVYTSAGISANTKVSLQKDGDTLISFTPAISCQYLTFSSPDIASGGSYQLYGGTSLLSTVTAGTGGNTGGRGGGGGRR